MGPLAKTQWEKFAQLLARGVPQTQAFKRAGYTLERQNGPANASRLANRAPIKARVKELQERAAVRTGYTVDKLVRELEASRKLAMRTNQPAAAVGASMGKAKLLGLAIDKAEIDATVRRPLKEPSEAKEMSFEEWNAKFNPETGTVQ